MNKTKHRLNLETIRRLIRKDARLNLRKLLLRIHTADLAAIMGDLSPAEVLVVFQELPDDSTRAAVLVEMDASALRELVEQVEPEKVLTLLKAMPPDDAAAIIDRLPEDQAEVFKEKLSGQELDQVEDLLTYPEETAGRIMTQEVFALPADCTVGEAIKRIREAERAETVFYIYVVDEHQRLLGVISLRKLLLMDEAATLKSIMLPDVISVTPDMDQEEVAHLVARYDLLAIPVVDELGKLLGIITVDDIIDIIREEAREDIYHLAGSSMSETDETSPLRMARIRLPWLGLRFIGGAAACAAVVWGFKQVPSPVVFGAFLPLMFSMINGIGTQSSTIVAEQLTADRKPTVRSLMLRELVTGLLIGIFYGVLSFAGTLIVTDIPTAWIIAIPVAAGMTGATVAGSLIPVIFFKAGKDPVMATGSIVASFLDITAVVIYLVCSLLLMA